MERDYSVGSCFLPVTTPLKNRVISRHVSSPRVSTKREIVCGGWRWFAAKENRFYGGDVTGDFNELTFHWAGWSTKRSTRGGKKERINGREKSGANEKARWVVVRFERKENFSASSLNLFRSPLCLPYRYEKKEKRPVDLLINLTSTARESKGF